MLDLRDRHVLVLGLGDSGLAMARWCAWCGATVSVADTRETPPQSQVLAETLPGVVLLKGFHASQLVGKDLLLKSPGLSPLSADVSAMLTQAQTLGIAVQGELDLFAQALVDLKTTRQYAPRVLAITGTNGKTTTTSLTAHLIRRAGWHVAMAGNIGPTMLDTLREALQADAKQATKASDFLEIETAGLPQAWVLELSSFQLDVVKGFNPSAAVVLNITQDHLDWHGSMADYVRAKANIFGPNTTMVVNQGDPHATAMIPVPAQAKPIGRGQLANAPVRRVVYFGLNGPERPGDFGLMNEAGMYWLARAMETDTSIKPKANSSHELLLQRLMPMDALQIRGRHNAANVLAALALATAVGVPLAPMLHGLREYRGEPHRTELVMTVNGIHAVDDSKGTNVGATLAAISGLGPDSLPSKLVLILGGDGKGQDFQPLREALSQYARAVAFIGRDGEAIETALHGNDRLKDLNGHAITVAQHSGLENATRWAFAHAQQGDTVLLSPACASVDMFDNYIHRARVFIEAVHELAHEQGVVS